MKTENIVKFLQTAYSDERLAQLLCHALDGKLGYGSCCCLIGIPTSDHALQESIGLTKLEARGVNVGHYLQLERSVVMHAAENEFCWLGANDAQRRERLIPLIEAEIARRDALKSETYPVDQGDEQPEPVRVMAE